jgi:hypothetical protein
MKRKTQKQTQEKHTKSERREKELKAAGMGFSVVTERRDGKVGFREERQTGKVEYFGKGSLHINVQRDLLFFCS